jgi:oligopeptide transport system ATP-binding protein
MTRLLEVSNLCTHFHTPDGTVKAVDGVSFHLDRGETLGIVGESGSGKSVTSLSLLRLVDPPGKIVAGNILFDGQDLLSYDDEQMRRIRGKRIAMVFQDAMAALNPVLTIGRQLTETLKVHLQLENAEARQRAVALLRLVGIPLPEQRLASYPHQLSGGMRQRVMIAIALSCRPDLLIADEPTSALDVTIQAQILELVRRLQTEMQMGVILITHDLGVIAGMVDRVLVMYAGKIVEEAPTEQIFADPRMPYTIGLIDALPRLDEQRGRLHPVRGAPPSLINLPDACPFAPRCDFARDICVRQPPPLRQVDAGHRAACHFDVHAPWAATVTSQEMTQARKFDQ